MATSVKQSAASYSWWQRGVIYQIYPRSFMDANGDGVGDLRGVTERLAYLSSLGVDAIWRSPIYPSPMQDFGYDVSDYRGIHELFGSIEDFRALVAVAHEQGLKVLIDYVPNHSASDHPWFRESRSGRDSARRDWYIWADPRDDGGPPNNWLSVFGGSAWTFDEPTGQYYLHSFLESMPDLNWRSHGLREAMYGVLRYWLDLGVDGFRVDAAHYIMKDAMLRSNPPNPEGIPSFHRPMGEYDTQLHLYDRADPDIHEVYRHIRSILDSYGTDADAERIAVGEIHLFDWPVWAAYYGQNLDELHMPLNFGLLTVDWSASALRSIIDTVEAALPEGAWPNYVLGNHDESRLASRVGPAQARAAMMVLLTLRGTPTIYYGDELGMHDVEIPLERVQDPWGKRVKGLGRDPGRTPMLWSDEPGAGFTTPGVEPWLPLGPWTADLNVDAQKKNPWSQLVLTRELLAVRRSTPALSVGIYAPIELDTDDCLAYLREYGDSRVVVLVNMSSRALRLRVPMKGRGTILVSTYMDRRGEIEVLALSLRPHEGVVISME